MVIAGEFHCDRRAVRRGDDDWRKPFGKPSADRDGVVCTEGFSYETRKKNIVYCLIILLRKLFCTLVERLDDDLYNNLSCNEMDGCRRGWGRNTPPTPLVYNMYTCNNTLVRTCKTVRAIRIVPRTGTRKGGFFSLKSLNVGTTVYSNNTRALQPSDENQLWQ